MTRNYQSLAIHALCTPFICKEKKKNPRHSRNFVQFKVKPYEIMFGNFSWFLLLLLLLTKDSSGLQYIIYNTKRR